MIDIDDTPSFPKLAGIALIVLALTGPMAYCAVHIDAHRPTTVDLKMECIKSRGEWKSDGWSAAHCVFPKASDLQAEKK